MEELAHNGMAWFLSTCWLSASPADQGHEAYGNKTSLYGREKTLLETQKSQGKRSIVDWNTHSFHLHELCRGDEDGHDPIRQSHKEPFAKCIA